MKYLAQVNVIPQPELLDPQGKAVLLGLHNLGLATVADVRVGKHIQLQVEAQSQQEAEQLVEKACKTLLANPIMENFSFAVQPMA